MSLSKRYILLQNLTRSFKFFQLEFNVKDITKKFVLMLDHFCCDE